MDTPLLRSLDHDFEKGAELENNLLRLRHQWELKDQKRREALEQENEAEKAREEKRKEKGHERLGSFN